MPIRRHDPRGRSVAGVVGGAGAWLAMGFALALLIPAVLPSAVGYRTYVVRSNSMEPSISRGDVLVSDPVPASKLEEGDVVTLEGSRDDASITHRIRSANQARGEVQLVTQGDANEGVERWQVPADSQVPRVSYTIPKLGYTTLTAEDPQGRLIVIGLLMLTLGVSLRVRHARTLGP